MDPKISPIFVSQLCADSDFIRSIQQIVSETRTPVSLSSTLRMEMQGLPREAGSAPCESTINDRTHQVRESASQQPPKNRQDQRGTIQIEEIAREISQAMLDIVLQQTNQAYAEHLRIASELEKLREAVERITGGEGRCRENSKEKEKTGADTSMFFEQGLDSSLEIKNLRRQGNSDKLSFSFINSFVNENGVSSEELSERINASISKVESSIEDRIAALEKEFTRRIEQVMKTIKHLIHNMSEEEHFKKKEKRPAREITEFEILRPVEVAKKSNTSPLQELKQRVFHSNNTPAKEAEQSQGLVNKSQSRISSFFGLGGSGKHSK